MHRQSRTHGLRSDEFVRRRKSYLHGNELEARRSAIKWRPINYFMISRHILKLIANRCRRFRTCLTATAYRNHFHCNSEPVDAYYVCTYANWTTANIQFLRQCLQQNLHHKRPISSTPQRGNCTCILHLAFRCLNCSNFSFIDEIQMSRPIRFPKHTAWEAMLTRNSVGGKAHTFRGTRTPHAHESNPKKVNK